MAKIPTVTIGVPAFNEEQNIANLLGQLLAQTGKSFKLEAIYVMSDGSSDNTNAIVTKVSQNNKLVKLVPTTKRYGKVFQLNKLYKLNKSDYLISFDADIKLKDNSVVSKAVSGFAQDKLANVGAIHQVPIRPSTFIGRCIYAGYEFWDIARLSVPKSDHIQNLYGAATIYKKAFVTKFRFPKDITDDRGYLYLKAKETGGFVYIKSTHIQYLPVSTLHDFRKLADRSFNKNEQILRRYYGDKIDTLYKIPTKNKIVGILTVFIKEPFYCTCGILLNILTRLFPYHDNLYKSKMWEVSKSTKKFI